MRHLARQVSLVREEHKRHMPQMLAHLAPPPHEVVERVAIARVENQAYCLGASIKASARRCETLLSSQIPDHQTHRCILDPDLIDVKIDANRHRSPCIEYTGAVALDQAGFADVRISAQYHFK